MPARSPLRSPILALIDRQLADQTGARASLARHAGKQIRLRLPLATVAFRVTEGGGVAEVDPDSGITAEIAIAPDILLALALGERAALTRAAVAGDAVLAADLATALDRFDWALALRPYLGDILAARAAQGISGLDRWRVEAQTSLGQAAAEYLSYESGLLADAPAVLGFVADVDELRDAAARLEARLTLLENHHA